MTILRTVIPEIFDFLLCKVTPTKKNPATPSWKKYDNNRLRFYMGCVGAVLEADRTFGTGYKRKA